MKFFIGWHQPVNGVSGCTDFEYCMVSVNRLLKRRSPFTVQNWIMDSGAFTRISLGAGHLDAEVYASQIFKWGANVTRFVLLSLMNEFPDCLIKSALFYSRFGFLLAAVTQDYMCEPFIRHKTGLTVRHHQLLTISRYDRLRRLLDDSDVYLMPVLQGFTPDEYVQHIRLYRDRLPQDAWVGVGSVCKRNGSPSQIENVLLAIKQERPDLRLHGFGLKKTALSSGIVHALLYSADSQAHSFRQRMAKAHGETVQLGANNPQGAIAYWKSMESTPLQLSIWAS